METWLVAWRAGRVRKACSFLVYVALLCLVGRLDVARAAQGETFEVDAALPLVATGIFVEGGQHVHIKASGSVNLALFDGPYITDANGTILVAPPPGSGAFEFFRDMALPRGVDPVVGARKLIPLGFYAPLPGAPYGALVAGFSPLAAPTSFADFPSGFVLTGKSGKITAPAGGGYLFLAVNDIPGVDNGGSFTVEVH
jgi:hypothetical protein